MLKAITKWLWANGFIKVKQESYCVTDEHGMICYKDTDHLMIFNIRCKTTVDIWCDYPEV